MDGTKYISFATFVLGVFAVAASKSTITGAFIGSSSTITTASLIGGLILIIVAGFMFVAKD